RQVPRMPEKTLDSMALGGMYDLVGGGFHRYSVDRRWLVPHFEKMLYDNALLASTYLDAFQATGEPRFATIVRETMDYVLREMTHSDGGFYSTQDADSEGAEGKFFVWTKDEIESVLAPEESRVLCYCYDVTPEGNWEGHNILNRVKTTAQAARVLGLSEADLDLLLISGRKKLFERREQRVHPGRDDKILAGWNGLMIAAMARAGRVLDERRFTAGAARSADFLLSRLRTPEGRLLHVFKDGTARLAAYLDDYACALDALAEVYQATFDPRYVAAAAELAADLIANFADSAAGGFFYTAHDHETLIARSKDLHDNATPSGNGMAAYSLLRLARLCGREDFDAAARGTLEMLSGEMARVTMATGQALLALDDLLGPSYELVLVDGQSHDETTSVLRALNKYFLPNAVIARRSADAGDSSIAPLLRETLAGKTAVDEQPTLYVCERGTCRPQVADLRSIEELLATL
ncbi:MAG TPA: thioredoxin domain-containing protein, partial [Planctomycetaceae bacterium]|nr:thioredoxin domain-containing protein [Planctomycetaceae bacterium]